VSRAPWVATSVSTGPLSASHRRQGPFIRQAHQEAVARINFCIVESAIGVSQVTSAPGRQSR